MRTLARSKRGFTLVELVVIIEQQIFWVQIGNLSIAAGSGVWQSMGPLRKIDRTHAINDAWCFASVVRSDALHSIGRFEPLQSPTRAIDLIANAVP
jgi:hypothetical protein